MFRLGVIEQSSRRAAGTARTCDRCGDSGMNQDCIQALGQLASCTSQQLRAPAAVLRKKPLKLYLASCTLDLCSPREQFTMASAMAHRLPWSRTTPSRTRTGESRRLPRFAPHERWAGTAAALTRVTGAVNYLDSPVPETQQGA